MKKQLLLLFFGMLQLLAQSQPVTGKQPNVIIIVADQWRGQALGFLHQEKVKTPNLDRLAAQSLVLTNFISNYPVCSPARAMLMTGRYPFSNGVYSNVQSESAPYGVQLDANATCWSDLLKQAGYSLGYIGKWHLDSPHPPYIPTSNNNGAMKWNEWTEPARRHGFDYWYAYGTYDMHLKPMYWDNHAGRMDFEYINQWGPEHEVDKAIAFMDNKDNSYRKAGNPFAMVISMNPPHTGYNLVPDKYYAVYKDVPLDSLIMDPDIPAKGTPMGDAYRKDIRYYYACMTGVDDQLGRLFAYLKEKKLDQNTIILFTSDHGNCLGKHDMITKNNLYEESLRVPFILYWKGHIKPDMKSDFLMSYPDIYPTLIGLTGVGAEVPAVVEGINYAPYILQKTKQYPKSQYFLGEVVAPEKQMGFRGIRTKEFKLAYYRKKPSDPVTPYLFNIVKDPFEMNNLYDADPVTVKKLKTELEQWLNKTKDPFRLR